MLSASQDANEDSGKFLRGRYLFDDDFELDLERGSLACGGEEIPLRPKSFAVLKYLIEHAGQLVTKQDLMDAVWPDVVVTDDSIAQCLVELRRALGDDQRTIIRTVPRRGLIFDVFVRFEESAEPVIARSRSRTFRPGWPVFAALVVAATLLWWWADLHKPDGAPNEETAVATAPTTETIAVLRFTDLSRGGDQAYLADGISEEIMHILTQSPSLRVIARTSAFAVEEQPVAEIARRLGVSYVLEGSVRMQDDQIRITAQLIDAANSLHLWSRAYDRGIADILEVQKEIARSVADALEVVLTDADDGNDVDPHAYQLFLEGRYLHFRGQEGDLFQAWKRYAAALAISPEYAPAWTGLSATSGNILLQPDLYGWEPTEGEGARLREINRHATMQALRYGPDLPEAHMRVARYYYFNGDHARAREHVETARSIDPDHWLVRSALVNELTLSGRIEEAVDLLRRNIQRDPLNMFVRENLVWALIWTGRFEDAIAELEHILDLAPSKMAQHEDLSSLWARTQILVGNLETAVVAAKSLTNDSDRLAFLAIAYHALGRPAESSDSLSKLVETADNNWGALNVAEVFAQRREAERALSWLERIEIESTCDHDIFFSVAVYYSPFLADLDGMEAWESYRTGVLQGMSSCLLGLDLPSHAP
ncbi:MAG: tetratricopeptide repeat protein [Lysobacterales bacterium]